MMILCLLRRAACLCLLSEHRAPPDNEHSSPPGSSLAHSNNPHSSHTEHSLSSEHSCASVSLDDHESVLPGLRPPQSNRPLSDQDASPSQPKHTTVSRLSLPDHNKPLPDHGLSPAHSDDSPSPNECGSSSCSRSAPSDDDPSSLPSHCCSSDGDCSASGSQGRSAGSHSSPSTGQRSPTAGENNSSSSTSNNYSSHSNLSCSNSSCPPNSHRVSSSSSCCTALTGLSASKDCPSLGCCSCASLSSTVSLESCHLSVPARITPTCLGISSSLSIGLDTSLSFSLR